MNIKWLDGDIAVGALTFRHGDKGKQEFYECKNGRFSCGLFRNHGERCWFAYAINGDRVRMLNTAVRHLDGRIEEDPLWRVRSDVPKPLCAALEKLWRKHGTGMMDVPSKKRKGRRAKS